MEPIVSRGFKGRRADDVPRDRVPPGQYVTDDYPVLSAGPTPHTPLDRWDFSIVSWQGVSIDTLLDGIDTSADYVVEAGDVQPVIAGEADRQLAGPAPNVEDASAFGGRSPDVLGDPLVQGAEQEAVAKGVVGAGMSDEDASWHPSPPMSSQVTSDGYRARDRSDGSD
jgi:hypothetical protein